MFVTVRGWLDVCCEPDGSKRLSQPGDRSFTNLLHALFWYLFDATLRFGCEVSMNFVEVESNKAKRISIRRMSLVSLSH